MGAKTDVFATDTWGGGDGKNTPAFYSGFPTDFAFMKPVTSGGSWEVVSKNTQLRKSFLDQNAQMGNLSSGRLDFENGFYDSTASLSSYRGWMWQRSPKIMDLTSQNAVFMHCLPAAIGKEVTEDVIRGPKSITIRQAKNRMFVQMGLLEWLNI